MLSQVEKSGNKLLLWSDDHRLRCVAVFQFVTIGKGTSKTNSGYVGAFEICLTRISALDVAITGHGFDCRSKPV